MSWLGSVSFLKITLALNRAMGSSLRMNSTKYLVTSGPMRGMTLYVWPGVPNMWYNADKVIVSKREDGKARFAIAPELLKPVA
jgi:hypothetical protein